MPGPPPKDNPLRRNKPELGWVDLPAEGRTEAAPKPPTGHGWSKRAMAYWRDVWSTPSATQWVDRGDYQTVVRRTELEDAWGSTKDPKYLAEMRHLETALGLTAKARKELRWRIVEGDTVVEQNGKPVPDELAARRAGAAKAS